MFPYVTRYYVATGYYMFLYYICYYICYYTCYYTCYCILLSVTITKASQRLSEVVPCERSEIRGKGVVADVEASNPQVGGE